MQRLYILFAGINHAIDTPTFIIRNVHRAIGTETHVGRATVRCEIAALRIWRAPAGRKGFASHRQSIFNHNALHFAIAIIFDDVGIPRTVIRDEQIVLHRRRKILAADERHSQRRGVREIGEERGHGLRAIESLRQRDARIAYLGFLRGREIRAERRRVTIGPAVHATAFHFCNDDFGRRIVADVIGAHHACPHLSILRPQKIDAVAQTVRPYRLLAFVGIGCERIVRRNRTIGIETQNRRAARIGFNIIVAG